MYWKNQLISLNHLDLLNLSLKRELWYKNQVSKVAKYIWSLVPVILFFLIYFSLVHMNNWVGNDLGYFKRVLFELFTTVEGTKLDVGGFGI